MPVKLLLSAVWQQPRPWPRQRRRGAAQGLHSQHGFNMRTVFALKKDKQKAVAIETQQVWCSLAERLGMMAIKVQ